MEFFKTIYTYFKVFFLNIFWSEIITLVRVGNKNVKPPENTTDNKIINERSVLIKNNPKDPSMKTALSFKKKDDKSWLREFLR